MPSLTFRKPVQLLCVPSGSVKSLGCLQFPSSHSSRALRLRCRSRTGRCPVAVWCIDGVCSASAIRLPMTAVGGGVVHIGHLGRSSGSCIGGGRTCHARNNVVHLARTNQVDGPWNRRKHISVGINPCKPISALDI